ncbi:MAG: toxin TcdB middle/N-terminal domain-containing protein, partial [Sedimenticola sp.]
MASEVPGILPGELSVTQTGAAHYTIPLAVPKGTAGMEPSLSLGYNSQGSSGQLGAGWSLNGLSAITRCGRTLVQDGASGGIEFTDNDRYCLDGQRLVAVRGAYGHSGTEYRTEIDRFARIVSHGRQGKGPAWFSVQTKSGQTIQYGNTGDARIEAQGRGEVFTWAQNRITDAVGNTLTVSYHENNANTEHYPGRIDYSEGLSVRFGYVGKPDLGEGYIAGAKVKSTKRLISIKTFVGSSLVHHYAFTYKTREDKQALLQAIQQCDGAGHCLPATSLTWHQAEEPKKLYGSYKKWLSSGYPVEVVANDGDYAGHEYRPKDFDLVDMNGDGLGDVVVSFGGPKYSWMNDERRFYFSTGNGFSYAGKVSAIKQYPLFFGDVNGDGIADAIRANLAGNKGKIEVALGTGHGFGGYRTWLSSYPVDEYQNPNDQNNPLWKPRGFDLVDLDGDGKLDLVSRIKETGRNLGERKLYRSTGSGFVPTGTLAGCNNCRVVLGDVSGDGVADAIRAQNHHPHLPGAAKIEVALGTSSGFGEYRTWLASGYATNEVANASGDSVYRPRDLDLVDLNGDGFNDLVAKPSNKSMSNWSRPLFISSGSKFTAAGSEQGCAACRLVFGDANGDSIADAVRAKLTATPGQSGSILETALGIAFDSDRLTHITDSLGNLTTLSYAKATDAGMHTLTGSPAYPTRHMRFPALIVSAVDTDNGLGGTRRTNYHYGGGKTHLKGRGFLGFQWMKAADTQTGITTTTTYRQDFPYTGKVAATEQRQANGKLLGRTTATWAKKTQHGGKTHFPYISRSVDDQYQLDGHHIATTTTTSQYDGYGNPTRITATTTGGGEQVV